MNNPEIWWVPVTLYVLAAFVGIRVWQKTIVGLPSRTRRLALQFFFCLLFASAFWAIKGSGFRGGMTIVFGLGMLNGLANLFHWKAVDTSLSKSSLLMFSDDVVAMGLSYLILNEGQMITGQTGIGILVCLIVVILFGLHSFQKGDQAKALFANIVGFSVLWGVALFGARYFAFNQLAVEQFIVSWYAGTFFMAILLNLFYKDKSASQQRSVRLTFLDYLNLFGFAGGIFLCLGILYWAYRLAPLIAVQPILLLGEAILPTLAGLILFKEARGFDKREWVLGFVGLIGLGLIAFGLR